MTLTSKPFFLNKYNFSFISFLLKIRFVTTTITHTITFSLSENYGKTKEPSRDNLNFISNHDYGKHFHLIKSKYLMLQKNDI